MRKRIGVLALMAAMPGAAFAMPEPATHPAGNAAEAKLLELADPLIANVGVGREILLYGEYDRDDADPGFRFAVRYSEPGDTAVWMQSDKLTPIVPKLFGTITEAWRADDSWFSFAMVIRGGTPSISFQTVADLGDPDPQDFEQRFDKATALVFPDKDIVRYAPGM